MTVKVVARMDDELERLQHTRATYWQLAKDSMTDGKWCARDYHLQRIEEIDEKIKARLEEVTVRRDTNADLERVEKQLTYWTQQYVAATTNHSSSAVKQYMLELIRQLEYEYKDLKGIADNPRPAASHFPIQNLSPKDIEELQARFRQVKDKPPVIMVKPETVPVSSISPSGTSAFQMVEYAISEEDRKRRDEENTYFEITGNQMSGKLTTYSQWRKEYERTGMSLPFERMMELVTPEIKTKALDGYDIWMKTESTGRKKRYWHDIDGRPHEKPDRVGIHPAWYVLAVMMSIAFLIVMFL